MTHEANVIFCKKTDQFFVLLDLKIFENEMYGQDSLSWNALVVIFVVICTTS